MYESLYIKCRYSCQILAKLEFSREDFEKSSNIKFHENPSGGSRVVPCGQTDRHDEANIRFSHKNQSANTKAMTLLQSSFRSVVGQTDEKES